MSGGEAPLAPGLYLVGTPIGNLDDISLRALRVLGEVDRILCEDTRETQHLLDRYGIRKPLTSCHEHNEAARIPETMERLRAGERVALVTDAGLPGISDPGAALTRACVAAGIAVIPIPGANAALTALVASGLSTERFLFYGFLPAKGGTRRSALERLAAMVRSFGEALTLVFYEAPHRILEMLAELEAVWGPEQPAVAARELTKVHEEFVRGSIGQVRSALAARERVRGELVVLVHAPPSASEASPSLSLSQQVRLLVAEEGLTEKDALKRAARERGIGKSEAYREWQRERGRG